MGSAHGLVIPVVIPPERRDIMKFSVSPLGCRLMISTQQDFEEGTAFELYVLERVRPAIEQHGGAYIDLRGSKTVAAVGISVGGICSEAGVNELKDQLAPLLFGAAWKVLDLLLEFALNKARLTPKANEWRIAEKQQHALKGRGDRSVLQCSQPVWETLLRVYANTDEHRHCLIHRTAKVEEGTGTMEGIDRKQRPLRPLTRDHQVALAKVAALAARGVIEGGIDRRSEDHLKYQLDQLTVHTGSPAFGVGGTSAPAKILLELGQENGVFFLDMSGVMETARKTFGSVAHFNVLVDVPDGAKGYMYLSHGGGAVRSIFVLRGGQSSDQPNSLRPDPPSRNQ